MAYKIQYSSIGIKKYVKGKRSQKRFLSIAALSALIVFISLVILSHNRFYWLVPGDPDVTLSAMTALISDLSEGTPLGEAIVAFCREVIAGAQ